MILTVGRYDGRHKWASGLVQGTLYASRINGLSLTTNTEETANEP